MGAASREAMLRHRPHYSFLPDRLQVSNILYIYKIYTYIYIFKYIIWYYMFFIVFNFKLDVFHRYCEWERPNLAIPLLICSSSSTNLTTILHHLLLTQKPLQNFLPREVFTQKFSLPKMFRISTFWKLFFFFMFFSFFPYSRHQSHGPHTCPLILRLLLGVWGAWKPPISGFNTLPETNVAMENPRVLMVKNQERWELSWANW